MHALFSEPENPEDLDDQRVDTLVERLRETALSEPDKATITKVLRSYLYLMHMVRQTGARLRLIREFLFGKKKHPDTHARAVWVREVRIPPQTGRPTIAHSAAKTEKPKAQWQTAEASQQPAQKHR